MLYLRLPVRSLVKSHFRMIFFGASLVVIAACLTAFVHNLNAPAYGTISLPAQDAQKATPSTKNYSGHFIGFKFPAHYNLSYSRSSNSLLEGIYLISADHKGKYVAINIYRGQLDNDSGVSYRRSHPDLYKESDSASALIFTKNQDGAEFTAFLQHSGMIASISFTAPLAKDFSSDYHIISGSWLWK